MKPGSSPVAALAAGVCISLTLAIPLGVQLSGSAGKAVSSSGNPADPAASSDIAANTLPAPDMHLGSVSGVIRYDGDPPARPVLVRKGDPDVKDTNCCAAQEILSETLVVNTAAGHGVANVLIYLRNAPVDYVAPPVPTEPVVMQSVGCRYQPHVVALRCDQPFQIRTADTVSHAANIMPVRNTGILQLVSASKTAVLNYSFPRPETVPVPILCSLHPWMRAYCLPLEHPFVAVTDGGGRFRIAGLPPGEHKFRVWHELRGYLEKELTVEIRAGEETALTLSYPPTKFPKP